MLGCVLEPEVATEPALVGGALALGGYEVEPGVRRAVTDRGGLPEGRLERGVAEADRHVAELGLGRQVTPGHVLRAAGARRSRGSCGPACTRSGRWCCWRGPRSRTSSASGTGPRTAGRRSTAGWPRHLRAECGAQQRGRHDDGEQSGESQWSSPREVWLVRRWVVLRPRRPQPRHARCRNEASGASGSAASAGPVASVSDDEADHGVVVLVVPEERRLVGEQEPARGADQGRAALAGDRGRGGVPGTAPLDREGAGRPEAVVGGARRVLGGEACHQAAPYLFRRLARTERWDRVGGQALRRPALEEIRSASGYPARRRLPRWAGVGSKIQASAPLPRHLAVVPQRARKSRSCILGDAEPQGRHSPIGGPVGAHSLGGVPRQQGRPGRLAHVSIACRSPRDGSGPSASAGTWCHRPVRGRGRVAPEGPDRGPNVPTGVAGGGIRGETHWNTGS